MLWTKPHRLGRVPIKASPVSLYLIRFLKSSFPLKLFLPFFGCCKKLEGIITCSLQRVIFHCRKIWIKETSTEDKDLWYLAIMCFKASPSECCLYLFARIIPLQLLDGRKHILMLLTSFWKKRLQSFAFVRSQSGLPVVLTYNVTRVVLADL